MEIGRMKLKGNGFIEDLNRVQIMIDEIQKEFSEDVIYECDADDWLKDEFLVIKDNEKIYVVTSWYEGNIKTTNER